MAAMRGLVSAPPWTPGRTYRRIVSLEPDGWRVVWIVEAWGQRRRVTFPKLRWATAAQADAYVERRSLENWERFRRLQELNIWTALGKALGETGYQHRRHRAPDWVEDEIVNGGRQHLPARFR
jgi:hypothetical protein